MADITKFQTLERFAGIVNVDPANRLNPLVLVNNYVRDYTYPLQQAVNVDIDNTFGISSRPGYTPVLTGTEIHSLWSDNVNCLFVDNDILKRFFADWTTLSLRSGLTNGSRMSYAPWNDRIYYTNGYEIGYVKVNTSYDLVDPVREFKAPLPPGKFIAYYRARLYVARDKILYISDPLSDYYDIRNGYKLFSGEISMVRPVDDGIYVADEKVYWLKGAAPDDFERDEAYPYRPIPYTDLQVNGQSVGEGVRGNVAMWTGENGICMGDNAGAVVNITEGRYTFTKSGQGTGFIRDENNVRHYVNSLY